MNKEKLLAALLSLQLLIASSTGISWATIGMLETKRQRLDREFRETGRGVQTEYQQIRESFLRGDYKSVDKLAEQYLSGGVHGPEQDDVLYLQAMSLLKLGRGEEARKKFREIENRSSSLQNRANAAASIADSHFYEGDKKRAYETYQEALTHYPSSDQASYFSKRLQELSPKEGAPSSNSLPQISYEENHFFAVQVGSFSKPENAQTLLGKLIRRHFDAYLAPDEKSGMHRVRVGRLASLKEARRLAHELRRQGYPTKILP